MKEKVFVGTNTKMYQTIAQAKTFLTRLGELTADIPRAEVELFVIPSFTALEAAGRLAHRYHIRLGAQNMGWEDEGPFTGEISPLMLRETGVELVELGHSERRHVLGEDDELLNRKVQAALRHPFTVLLCVGETERQKELGLADEMLRVQLKTDLYGVEASAAPNIRIAYEPVWAIGAGGHPASAGYAQQRHITIRGTLFELFGEQGRDIPILYGGSVNRDNAKELIRMPDIDGLFIGRSAWNADNFNEIIRTVLPITSRKAGLRNISQDETHL